MLKSLEVFGFKSFADRTVFAFAPGITCVVGPNGSGKSNVVDAMKWLLGDQSPKNLRGKSMADVIFNGSRGRKASGLAEATLTFDNTEHILDTPFQEVRITRRLYQGGDSEYLINGEISRLKDIRELFAGTGAATSAYSIIEQGRVGQVLQGNPSTRRILFDEAAGISRFKSRRTDAESKLERVSQNLLRLTDIVDEVESQLNTCRSKAGKAAKYRELSEQYDALRLGIAADDFRCYAHSRQEVDSQLQKVQQAFQETQLEWDNIEQEREQLQHRSREADDVLQQREERYSHLLQQRSSMETSLKHQRERLQEVESELDVLHRQRFELRRRVHEIDEEITREKTEWDREESQAKEAETERDTLETRLEEINTAVANLRQEKQQLESERAASERRQAAAESHQQHLKTRQETVSNALERLTSERNQLNLDREARVASEQETRAQYDLQVEKHQALRVKLDELTNARQDKNYQLDQLSKRQHVDREQRSAWEARLGLLEDMEQRKLGLCIGVQEILDRARKSPLPPWKHIIGLLVDFFDCDLEFAPLIEIALAGASQMVVVDQLSPIVEYLDRNPTQFEGRVSFIELPQKMPNSSKSDQPSGLEGILEPDQDEVVDRADRLIRCQPMYRPLFERLLKHTWIVNTLEEARRLRPHIPAEIELLTVQGDMVRSAGIIQTGTILAEDSIVSRRSEILRIRQELSALERHLKRLGVEISDAQIELQQLDQDREAAQHEFDVQGAEVAEWKQRLLTRQTEVHTVSRDLERVTTDWNSLQSQLETLSSEIEEQQAKWTELAAERDATQVKIEEAEEQIETSLRDRSEVTRELEVIRAEVAKSQERRQTIETVRKRLLKDRDLRTAQYKEALTRQENASEKRSQLELQTLNSQAHLAELYLIGEQLQLEVTVARKGRSEIDQQRESLNETLKGMTELRRQQEQSLSDLRIELRDVDNEWETIREGLDEDYQLSILDLLEQNVSAAPAFHALHHGEEIPPLYVERKAGRFDKPATHAEEASQVEESAPEDDQNTEAEHPAEVVLSEEELRERIQLEIQEATSLIMDTSDHNDAWAESEIPFEEAREEIVREVQRLHRRIKALGAVDPESLQGLDELEHRFRHLNAQLQDLKHARATLEEIISKINSESKRMFMESFVAIRAQFQELFRQLFGGGEGDIVMEDESDPLECGIEIVARPPGKELRSISLLSGGEKTMTAVGLLLAIFKSRPSPFCILDECDAALDEANIDRFANVIKEFKDKTQFIVISHRKRTMTAADRIFGVTMQEAGVSTKLTVRFEDVGENGEILTSSDKKAA